MTATLDRPAGLVAIVVTGPDAAPPDSLDGIGALGVEFWPLAMTRELDDLVEQVVSVLATADRRREWWRAHTALDAPPAGDGR